MINFVLTSVAICLFIYKIFKWSTANHDEFEKQGLKYVKPLPFIGTSGYAFGGSGLLDKIIKTYEQFPNEKVVGLFEFVVPLYFIRSPELAKQITVKDFAHFQDHKGAIDASADEFFGSNLISLKGKQWRDMRSSLSPMFTGSKMRIMLQLIVETCKQCVDYLSEDYKKNGLKSHDVKDVISRYTNDVIATCAFGVGCDSFRNPSNEIYQIGEEVKRFHTPTFLAKFMCMRFFPRLSRALGLKIVSDKTRKSFEDLIVHTMEVRKRDGIVRPDMLQLLMNLRDGKLSTNDDNNFEDIDTDCDTVVGGDAKQTWTDIELISQSYLFFIAGFESGSTVMTFMAYELALNPDVQSKLIQEIDETYASLDGKPLTYEILRGMKYLEMVVSETLRKWPPGMTLDRECVKTYNYQDEDGLKFTIEKGSMVWIPAYAYHRDPKYYPDPEKFDPERFSDENKRNINMDTYLPFGTGPRNCIGLRFALMEMKALLFHLLLSFRIKQSEDTQVPLRIKKSAFNLVPEKAVRLCFEPRMDKLDNN